MVVLRLQANTIQVNLRFFYLVAFEWIGMYSFLSICYIVYKLRSLKKERFLLRLSRHFKSACLFNPKLLAQSSFMILFLAYLVGLQLKFVNEYAGFINFAFAVIGGVILKLICNIIQLFEFIL
jgi:hypothetical protein